MWLISAYLAWFNTYEPVPAYQILSEILKCLLLLVNSQILHVMCELLNYLVSDL